VRELRIGEDVLAPDGERLGSVERLVIDPTAHRVTHIVVDGRVLGLARIRDAGPDGLVADLGRDGLARLPEVHSELLGTPGEAWSPPPGYRLQNFLSLAEAIVGQGPYVPPVQADLDLSTVHEITPSSPVWSGKRRLGEVAEVLTDDSGALIDFVLDRGFLHRRVRVPAGRVVEVIGNNVHVDLTEEEVTELPPEDIESGTP
jgi:uncharacterized protein YrrD